MNTLDHRTETEMVETTTIHQQETEVPVTGQKKKYVAPVITEPQDVLETTRFFFQTASGGSGL